MGFGYLPFEPEFELMSRDGDGYGDVDLTSMFNVDH
jgi:hypothetical protein